MENIRTTFITTVKNEEKTIVPFLHSLFRQSVLPDEIIIVDGGSTDNTVKKMKYEKLKMKKDKVNFNIFERKGNRAQGRNFAIQKASGNIIFCSDAGCVLDKYWVERISKPFYKKTIGIVAGFYRGECKKIFQECVVPYVLVMPDKLDENTFLPSARSMAFRKTIWKALGKFPERFSQNEDYVFAKMALKQRQKIAVARNALVYWIPPNTLYKTFRMLFRHAFGDAEALLFRPKVLLIFLRYAIALFLLFYFLRTQNYSLLYTMHTLIFIYLIYAVIKNYRYVNAWQAIAILPLLQITADIAVIAGTIIGLINHARAKALKI